MLGKKQNKRRQKHKSFTTIFVLCFMIVFGCAILGNLVVQINKYSALKVEEKEVQSKIDEELLKQAELNTQKEYYNSDAYVEKIAREQLGLVKPNEIIFKNKTAEEQKN